MMAGQRVFNCVKGHVEKIQSQFQPADSVLKLFVVHGASFRHCAHLMGVLSKDEIKKYSMHHCSPVYFEFTTSGQWQHIDGKWKQRDKAQASNSQLID